MRDLFADMDSLEAMQTFIEETFKGSLEEVEKLVTQQYRAKWDYDSSHELRITGLNAEHGSFVLRQDVQKVLNHYLSKKGLGLRVGYKTYNHETVLDVVLFKISKGN